MPHAVLESRGVRGKLMHAMRFLRISQAPLILEADDMVMKTVGTTITITAVPTQAFLFIVHSSIASMYQNVRRAVSYMEPEKWSDGQIDGDLDDRCSVQFGDYVLV